MHRSGNYNYLESEDILRICLSEVAPRIDNPSLRGLRDPSALERVCKVPQRGYSGDEMYHTVYEKAAALHYALDHEQPFIKGNKRTAVASITYFLAANDVIFQPDYAFVGVVLAIAMNKDYDDEDIALYAKYLEKLCRRRMR